MRTPNNKSYFPGGLATRRQFLAAGTFTFIAPTLWLRAAEAASAEGALASFDHEVEAFMQAREIPGGALAVVKDRKLIYARGYGWADREQRIPVRPETLFRIASLSKPFTAVAVLRLVEGKKLDLEARAFETAHLDSLPEARAASVDQRLWKITIRQLLQHTGGWDRDKSGDPMFRWKRIVRELKISGAPNPTAIIRHMLGRRLDFDPGARYAYSNFGYCVLGRVIEAVTGQPYEQFMREHILAPIGIKRMHIGASLQSGEGESRYYTADNAQAESVFPQAPGRVPEPYGGFSMEVMDAHGGWVASAVEVARFAAAMDDPKASPLLKRETMELMYQPPAPPAWRKADGRLEAAYYGCGWMVRPVASGGANYWHTGSLPGTHALLVRRWDRLSWVALFNQRSDDKKLPDDALDGALHRAAAQVKEWPKEDLFGR
jgi:N-acyl-D-amino-acid deacylase